MPKRIQRKRTKGWRMPEGAVYVGRPSRWGNPFVVGKDGDADRCVHKYVNWLLPYRHFGETATMEHFCISQANLERIQRELKGKDLACFCPLDQPCHANVLLELANA